MADNFDNYGMKVRATVDLPSVGDIDKQIRKLEKSISKLQVSGKLDDASLKALSHQLDTLKATVTTVNFSPTALTELTNQVNRALQNVRIDNIDIGNVNNQAQQVGQQIGRQVNQGLQQEINNNEQILNSFRESLRSINSLNPTIDMDGSQINNVVRDVENLGLRLESVKESLSTINGRRGTRNVLSVAITGFDEHGQALSLTRQYNAITGELIRNVNAVSTATQQANTQLENLTAQQIKRQQDLRNKLNKLNNDATNQNADRSITNLGHLGEISDAYDNALEAINRMGSSSKVAFAEQEAEATGLITVLENLIKRYRDAENVRTTLKPDKLAEGISKAQSKWKELDAEIKNSGVDMSDTLSAQVNQIEALINRIASDGTGLNKAEIETLLTTLTNAKQELNALTKIDKTETSAEVLKIQVGELRNELERLGVNNSKFNEFSTEINGVTHTVEDLNNELNDVKNSSDLKLATAKIHAFEDAFSDTNKTVGSTRDLLKEVNEAIDSKKYSGITPKITSDFEKLDSTHMSDESKRIYGLLETDYKELIAESKKLIDVSNGVNTTMSNEDKVKIYTKLESLIPKVKNRISELSVEQKKLDEVNEIQHLSNGGVKNDYATQIAQLEGNFRRLGLSQEEVSQKTSKVSTAFGELKTRVNQPFDESNYQEIINLNDVLQRELIESSNEYTKLQASFKGFATEQQRLSLANTIEAWNQKNTRATREVVDENHRYIMSLRDLTTEMRRVDFDRINTGFKQNENSMRAMNRLGKSLKEQFKQAYQSFTMWFSVSHAVMKVISEIREAFTELREINTLLTEISKANDKLTKEQLTQIGNNSFDVASKYGKSASDYLAGVQEASRAGYENAEAMAELSTAAQGAGNMTSDVANQFIIATDKAYKLNGSVTKLTKVLDGVNYITNHNAVNMTELSEAMTIVGSTAASFGVEANELTAALGTMAATTQQSGSEVARAFRAILLNIRQVSDEEEGIDAEGLTKYEKACNALGVSLKETRNGVLQTRDAMDVLKDLSVEYNKLEENDLRRTELLNSVGGKVYHVVQKCITRMYLIAGNPLEPCTTI